MRAAFAMTPDLQHRFFDAALLAELGELVDIDADRVLTSYDDSGAAEVEVLITAWGTPTIDASALARMPRLRAVVHAAGSVKYFLSPEAWERDLRVTCGVEPNARPVAEYALAAVLWATKSVLPLTERFRAERVSPDLTGDDTIDGAYGTTVGLLGASATGRALIEMLAPFHLSVLVSDPTIDAATAAEMGAEFVGLDDLFARSRVVSLHAPLLPQTRHLVDARLLGLMGDGTTLINTARGGVVDHDALRAEVVSGRLRAVLDVTEPEPLPAEDPMWSLPNVTLTPHVAG